MMHRSDKLLRTVKEADLGGHCVLGSRRRRSHVGSGALKVFIFIMVFIWSPDVRSDSELVVLTGGK